jgi:isopentenyl-diphosphate delta-isomerase
MDDENELMDLVDKTDKVIGTIKHKDAPNLVHTKTGYIRGVGGFVMNSKGQIWVPIRTNDKEIVPGGLDYSAAGHVRSGESYASALVREFKEELYLKLKESQFVEIGKVEPIKEVPYFFCGVFLYHSDKTPKYNPEDYTSYKWLLPTEVISLINAGMPAKNSLLPALKLLI